MTETLPMVRAEGGALELSTLSAADLRARVNLIQEVMRAVMKENLHYGKIPGTDKPTLYKAGSEVLLTTFRIAVDPEAEDLSTPDEIRYRIRCKAIHQPTGELLGVGVGEASSSEDKYQWRAAVCDEEWNETPENRRRIKYARRKREEGGYYTVRQVRTHPPDIANTVLKMAKKRAQIDMTLTVTGASDIFGQDLEEDDAAAADAPRGPAMPARKSAPETREPKRPRETEPPPDEPGDEGNERESSPPATEGQKRMIFAKLKQAGAPVEEFVAAFGKPIEELRMHEVNGALRLIEKGW